MHVRTEVTTDYLFARVQSTSGRGCLAPILLFGLLSQALCKPDSWATPSFDRTCSSTDVAPTAADSLEHASVRVLGMIG
jgi:hypothetical protein